MYENLNGISISGAMFDNEKKFNLFTKEGKNTFPTRFSLVYGKNGSGKSSITKGFQKQSGKAINSIESTELYDFNGSAIGGSEEINNNIFVFNEDFVEHNVKIKEDGLETIVMFGKQADLEEEIENLTQQIQVKRNQYKTQSSKCDDFTDSSKIVSPQYYLNRIKRSLKGDDNWAGRDGKIRGHRVNSSVNKSAIDSIIATAPKLTKVELEKDFENKLKEFNHINGEGKIITKAVPKTTFNYDTGKIHELLNKKIEKPKLSDREKKILELVLSGKQEHFQEIRELFSSNDVDYCPSCLQPVSENYKKELVNSIEKVLSKDVDEHTSELSKAKIPLLTLDLTDFVELNQLGVNECVQAIESANQIIEKYNSLLQKKIDNTYTPIKDEFPLFEKIAEIRNCLANLERSRIEYNKKFDELDSLRENLLAINKKLAYFDIIEDYNTYLKQDLIMLEEKKALETIAQEGKELNTRLASIQEEQKSIKIAVDFINNGLKYVFFSDQRLSIKTEDDRYVLFSNNRPVKPQDISCGERNILALCYFFTLTMSNLNEDNFYKKEVLLVIDDPVSSFDLENKVGILSYLKSQLLRVALGNLNSRVIIFSHDLPTVYDLYKQFEEIQVAVKTKNKESKNSFTTNFSVWELDNFELKKFSYRNRHEYSLMIETIYDYAKKGSNDDNLAIGNIMRRVLESFATFEYKKGIAEVSCDPDILSSMGNEKYSQYFENLMYRLVLNGESHLEDHVKSLQDLNFYSTVSISEKRRTSKDVLCLLNVLNPQHLTAHLKNKQKAILDVEEWCLDILNSMSS